MPIVEFLNAGKKVGCGQYANLRKVALLNNVPVYKGFEQIANCKGNGICGTCVVEVVEGLEHCGPMTLRERFKLQGKPANYRLSCQCQVMGDLACITAAALDATPAPAPAGR